MATLASRGALASLLGALDRPGSLVILPHDNPDPDALASAAALKYMFASLARKEAQIALGGIVGRAENRAMLTYLNITLVPVGGRSPGRRRRSPSAASWGGPRTAPCSPT